jgi:hypothetical protein
MQNALIPFFGVNFVMFEVPDQIQKFLAKSKGIFSGVDLCYFPVDQNAKLIGLTS